MLRRLQVSLVLLAWLLATGCQWDLVQSFAWGRMTANYAQSMPLLEAVAHTFMPNNMCEVCKAVAAAKQQQQHEQGPNEGVPGGSTEGKILVLFQPAQIIFSATPVFSHRLLDFDPVPGATRAAPPLPPPRAA